MHESEAIDFIASVLRGFLDRIFQHTFDDDEAAKRLYEPLIDKIWAYIEDNNGHWVKEKAIDVIHCIEGMETNIARGEFKPESPDSCVDIVLLLAQNMMQERVDIYKTEKNKSPKYIHDFLPLPNLKHREN
jgi:hypothetical protein